MTGMMYSERMIRPTRQAQIPGFSDGRFPVCTIASENVTVVAQHIRLTRIDTQAGDKPARTVINLFGTEDIDNLIAALQAAKARMVRESDALAQFEARQSAAA
jgi:hypothetical protein